VIQKIRYLTFLFPLALIASAWTSGVAAAQWYSGYGLRESTGNPNLDRLIVRELRELKRIFKVNPGFYVYDDHGRPNAAATLKRVRGDSDGTVLFGRTLLVRELYRGPYASIAVAGIMAHEFAHIVQLRRGAGRNRVMYLELHADCMAGWYLERSRRGDFDIQPFARSLYEKGDFAYWNRSHHGTPRQRIRAMIAGYKAGELGLDQVYQYCTTVATRVRS
jgi:hypothetical protein